MQSRTLLILAAIAVCRASGQEAPDAQRQDTLASSHGTPGTEATVPAREQQREQFGKAVREIQKSPVFLQERQRFERDLAELSPVRQAAPLVGNSQSQFELTEAARQFTVLESSVEVQIGLQEVQSLVAGLETSAELLLRKRLFQEEMKAVEATPSTQAQKSRLQRDLDEARRKE